MFRLSVFIGVLELEALFKTVCHFGAYNNYVGVLSSNFRLSRLTLINTFRATMAISAGLFSRATTTTTASLSTF